MNEFYIPLDRTFLSACHSGVAVSCGECSSSGTSDITEPGSPCSTSSDEGVAAIRGTSGSPLPSLPKLAPSSQTGTRPQWPWTPPLAATACSTTAYKRLRGEPEAGALPRSGAADPTSRGAVKANGKTAGGQHHHESQGKITEYFKTQIKPQQPKVSWDLHYKFAKNFLLKSQRQKMVWFFKKIFEKFGKFRTQTLTKSCVSVYKSSLYYISRKTAALMLLCCEGLER